jgi:hypothetical protein
MTLCVKMDVTGPLPLLDDEVQLSLSNALRSDGGQLVIKGKVLLRELEILVVLEVTFRKVRESFEEIQTDPKTTEGLSASPFSSSL